MPKLQPGRLSAGDSTRYGSAGSAHPQHPEPELEPQQPPEPPEGWRPVTTPKPPRKMRRSGTPDSGLVCPHCGETVDVFGRGGGALVTEAGLPFLGSVPLEPELVQAGDLGRPYMAAFAQSATAEAFRAAIRPLMALDECDQERSCGLIKADNEPTTHPRRIRLGVVLAHDLPR